MKQLRLAAFLLAVSMCVSSAAWAEDAMKKSLQDAVNYGVKVLETKGKAGMEELKSYRFADGQGYIYIETMDWIMLMHPAKELIGKDTTTTKDARGRFFGAEMKAKANKSGQGWTSYWWPNPKKNNAPDLKCSYYKVANMGSEKVVVAAGLFGISEGNCK